MKRINILLLVITALMLVFSSCNQYKEKSVTLKTELDSLNYSFGYVNGKILKQYHLNDDSTGHALNDLMKGIKAGLKMKNEETNGQEASELGKMIGGQLSSNPDFYQDSYLVMDFKLLRQGMINGIKQYEGMMTSDDAKTYFNESMEAYQAKKLEVEYQENKLANELFLSENALKEGVITTESGLQYEVIKLGKGAKPTAENKVKVHYHGTLIDGTVFDSSVDRGQPAEFFLNQVIKGWTEGVQLMPVGSKFKFYVPQDLAYGSANQGGAIQPFSTLIFEVELLEIIVY